MKPVVTLLLALCASIVCTPHALSMQNAEQRNTDSEGYDHTYTRLLALHLQFTNKETENSLTETKYLLKNKANPNGLASIDSGDAFLHYATLANSIKTAQILLENNASVDHRNTKNKKTPLMQAAAYGVANKMIQFLINHNANPTLCDNNKLTPLHMAAQQQQIQTTQCLIDNNGDIYSKGSLDKSPYELLNQTNKEITALYQEKIESQIKKRKRAKPAIKIIKTEQ